MTILKRIPQQRWVRAGSGLGQWVSSLGFVDSGLVDRRDPWCVLAVALPPVTEDRQVLLSAPWKTP